jgi:hypothetical protein
MNATWEQKDFYFSIFLFMNAMLVCVLWMQCEKMKISHFLGLFSSIEKGQK